MEIKKLKLSYKELKQIKKGEVLYLKKDKSLISTPQINCDIILIISHYLQLGVQLHYKLGQFLIMIMLFFIL